MEMQWYKDSITTTEPTVVITVKSRADLFCEPLALDIDRSKGEADVYVQGLAKGNQVALLHDMLIVGITGFEKYGDFAPSFAVYKRGSVADGNARTVYELVGASSNTNLRAGITVHDTCGSWSSWPPHDFEVQALLAPVELWSDFEEQFALITEQPGGWALQMVRMVDGDVTVYAIGDGEIVDIPLSVHPIVAMPGVRLAYFWAYVNGGEKF